MIAPKDRGSYTEVAQFVDNDSIDLRSKSSAHQLPKEIFSAYMRDQGLLFFSHLNNVDKLISVYSGKSYYPLQPVGCVNLHDFPVELLEKCNSTVNQFFIGGPKACRLGWNLLNWSLAGVDTGFIEIPKTMPAFESVHSPGGDKRIPLEAHRPYRLTGLLANHRTLSRIVLRFFDSGDRCTSHVEEKLDPQHAGGAQFCSYQPLDLTVAAPANTAYGILSFAYDGATQQDEILAGYVFFARLCLRPAHGDSGAFALIAARPRDAYVHQQTVFAYGVPMNFSLISQYESNVILRKNERDHELYKFSDRRLPVSGLLGSGNRVTVKLNDSRPCRLFVDEAYCGESYVDTRNGCHVFLIPDRYSDGEMHFLQVRDEVGIRTLAQDFRICPSSMTPWSVLQKETTRPLPNYLSPAATYRYRSLQAHLEDPSKDKYGRWLTDNLMPLHRILEQGYENIRSLRSLKLRRHANPTVSIIIPARNELRATYVCLISLVFAYNSTSFDVILVDDGSNDETPTLPCLVENLRYIRNDVSQGFVRACNRGASEARGDYIVLLNNDTEITIGWLDELMNVHRTYENVGIAGSRLLYPDGRQQEAGGIVWKSGNPWNYGRGGNPADPRFSYVRQTDYLSGAAIMLPRKVWLDVGGLSDEYAPAYFEDTDLAFKVREIGLKTFYVPHSVVFHIEGLTGGTDTNSGIKRFQMVNQPTFKRRWAHRFEAHGKEGIDVDLEKDRGIRGRALFVDHNTPRPDFDAGSYAAVQEMRLFQALDYKVTFVANNVAYLGRYTENLQRLGIEVLYAPFYFSVAEVLERRGREFDVVYITRYETAIRYVGLVRQFSPQAKILFCNADLHFLRSLRASMRGGNDKTAVKEALDIREKELAIMRQVDLTLSYSDVELAVILSHNHELSRIAKAPWVVELPPTLPAYGDRLGIAFLGGYQHPPNIEAVEFFVHLVMPVLRQQANSVAFHVYGSLMPVSFAGLNGDDIEVHGYVEDINTVFDHHRVFVAPLLSGAGVKGKVIQAMAHGIPCVLSRIAAEGIDARAGRDYLIAETPKEWSDAVIRLYDDAELWHSISASARHVVAADYSFNAGLRQMRKALEAVDLYQPTQQ